MNKGVSETFDEHEQDTTRRAYSQEFVEGSKRTAQMQKFELEDFVRSESGTRPALSPDLIDHHVRGQMEDALGTAGTVTPIAATPLRTLPLPIPAMTSGEDPHSRPTIEAFKAIALEEVSSGAAIAPVQTLLPTPVGPEAASRETPASMVASVKSAPAPRTVSIPRWVLPTIIFVAIMLISAAGIMGFFLGRGVLPTLP